jgi:hypothetical protein
MNKGSSGVAVDDKRFTAASESQIPAILGVRFGSAAGRTLWHFLMLNSQQGAHG